MPELKKELTLFEATVYGVGLILGAGIYAILGEAAGLTGGSVALAFLIAASIASFTGLSYAELSSLFPKEEGDYLYVKEAFGNKRLSELTAVLRILVGVISAAAVALAFGGYLTSFLSLPVVPVAIALILILSFINFWGIDLSAKVNVAMTSIEVLGLLIIIYLGTGSWATVEISHMSQGFTGLFKSTFIIFFAYIGFESLVNVSEETEHARRKIPQAIIISIAITTVLYVLVAVSSVALVDPQVLGQSNSPLAVVGKVGWGPGAFGLISAIALFSTLNTVLIILISTSRMVYGVSKKKYRSFPDVFSEVNKSRKTPQYSILLICVLSALFALIGDIGTVAGLTNIFLLVVFVLVNAAMIKLRYRDIDREGSFTAPLNVGSFPLTALGGLVSCFGLAVFYVLQFI